MKDSIVLVTGGAGFIGSHLVDKLLDMGSEVRALDNFDSFYSPEEKYNNIISHIKKEKFKLIKANILDYQKLKSAMRGVDLVIHEAAQCGIRYSIQNPKKTHRINVTGTFHVLNAAKQMSVKRVIYASSSSIFGKSKYLPFDEKHPKNPNSPYAVSKLAGENYCTAFYEACGLDVVVLRYFSVYGPRMRPDLAIRDFTERIINGENPLMIYGDGNQTRDWTHVSDVVNATILAAEREEIDGEAFNIGYGKRTKVIQLLKMIINLLGREEKITIGHRAVYKGDYPHTQADIKKAERLIGYHPRIHLEKGLPDFLNWFLNERTQKAIPMTPYLKIGEN